jgi:glycosyltransferase involved in cell wall biosynthesis
MARAPRPKTVLFLGRITAQKGPESFVEAAARVLRVVPDVRFVMAGAGDLLPQMVRRVAQLRLGDHFHFTGFLHGVEVERMYAMSDVYVMPSVSEPFGISPLEAMLHDVPVIVPRRSGVAEVLTHALQVDFQDVDDLADKIVALLRHPALSRELRRGARRELRALRWEAAAERVLAIYRMVTG